MVVITGRSMEPEIPIGSLALLRPLDPGSDLVGESVAFLTGGGHLITHRVTRVATLDGVDYVETKGDANDAPDPVLTPASAIVGSVAFTVPFAGFVEAGAGRPVGVVTLLALMVAARASGALVRRERPR